MYKIIKIMYSRGGILRKIAHNHLLKKCDIFHNVELRKIFKELYQIDAGIGSYGWQSGLIDGPAKIGNYVSIAPNVARLKVNHPINAASTHPCFFNPIYKWTNNDIREYSRISIDSDVWIGQNVIILPSVKHIGTGAIIAAGAIVTKDIPPYEIWGGVPARFIKKRFTDSISKELLASEWWLLPEEDLKKIKEKFWDPEEFILAVNDLKNKHNR